MNWNYDRDSLIKKKSKFIVEKEFDVINFFKEDIIIKSYPFLVKLARSLLALPHSSAAVERAFSQLKNIKNEKRNCLSNETLESLMVAKVNKINLMDHKTVDDLYDTYEKQQSLRKRKSNEITESKSQITTQTQSQQMEIG